MSPVERVSQTDVPARRCCCELFRLSYRYAVRSRAGTRKRPARPGLTMERRAAQELLDRLHRAQNEYYAGGDSRGLSDLLAADVRWSVPGDNALAEVYIGVDHVLDYMQRRRRLAACTLAWSGVTSSSAVASGSGRSPTGSCCGRAECIPGARWGCTRSPTGVFAAASYSPWTPPMSTRSGPDVAADLSLCVVPRRAWMVRPSGRDR
jgi:hypothetical protein